MLENRASLLDCESVLSPQAERVSLLGQIPLSADDISRLGNLIKSLTTTDPVAGTKFLRDQALTCFCCFLVWMGIREYQGGNYWSAIHQIAGLPKGSKWQTKWGQIFLEFLREKGLPVFEDVGGHKYVTPILAHGGIPDYCLDDFFSKLLLPVVLGDLEVDPSDTEQILQEWQERSSLFQFTDKPVRRFILHGGKAAMDFLCRCIEMAQRAYEEDEVPSANELDIPSRIVQRFEKWWSSKRAQLSKQQPKTRFRRPAILLSPEFGEVYLHVPQQRLKADNEVPALEIEISSGETARQVLQAYKHDSLIQIEETQIPLSSLAERYEVRLLSNGSTLRSWTLKGMTNERPYMAFDQMTKKIIESDKLSCAPCWLVFPSRFSIGLNVPVLEEGAALYGKWQHLRAFLVDTTLMKEICLLGESGTQVIKIPVTSEASPKLTGGEVLPFVFFEGVNVYRVAPSLVIPLSDTQLSRWRLSIIPQGKTTLSTTYNLADIQGLQQDGADVLVSLSDECLLGKQIAGQFLVRLRGPLGRDRSFRFAVLPDLTIEFDQPLYVPTFERASVGLLSVATELADNLAVEKPCSLEGRQGKTWTIKIPETESKVKCIVSFSQVDGGDLEIPLVIYVPRLRLAVRGLSGQAMWQWSHNVLEISTDDYEDSQELFLLVDVPCIEEGQAIISLEGTEQQDFQQIRHGKTRFDLKAFSDTLRALRRAISRFQLTIKGHSLAQKIPILEVQASWLPEGVDWDQETGNERRTIYIVWRERKQVCNRVIRLWTQNCPRVMLLQEAVPNGSSELLIEKSVVELPPGKYLLQFAVEDEWSQASPKPPLQPDGITVFLFEIGLYDEQERYANTHLDSFCDRYHNRLSPHWQLVNSQRSLGNLKRWILLGFQPTLAIFRSEQKDFRTAGDSIILPFLMPSSLEPIFEARQTGCAAVSLCCKTQGHAERDVTGGVLRCKCSSDGSCTFEVQAEEELRGCSKCGLLLPAGDWEHQPCTGHQPEFSVHQSNEAFPVQLAVLWAPLKMTGCLQTFLSQVASGNQQLQKLEFAFPVLRHQYDSSRYKPDWQEWLNGLIETLKRVLGEEPQETSRSRLDLGWNVAYYQDALKAVLGCIIGGIHHGT